MKNKYILFIFFIAVFLIFNCGFARAALEVTSYPAIPGLTSPSSDCAGSGCLPIFIAYWFGLLVYIAGILSLISFVIGAVGIIGANATGNPSARGESMDRIKGAVLGLVLTVASFMLIRTINPTLITPTLAPLPGVDGVFYTNGTEDKPCPIENSDTSTIPQGFSNIKYVCASGPALLIWEFPKTGFSGNNDGYSGINVKRITCNNQTTVDGGSFRLAFETSGVYYCLGGCNDDMCSGYMSNAVTSSEDNISEPFNGNIKGIRIVNDSSNYYGAIFHQEIGLANGGECAYPIINYSQDSQCETIDMPAASVNIFKWNNANPPTSSGTGVDFYSEPYGSAADAQKKGEGFCKISNSNIQKTFIGTADSLLFYRDGSNYNCDYTKNTITQYKEAYETFKDRPGSINIKENYLVALFDDNGDNSGGSSYCQVFSKDVPNLNVQPFIATGHSIGNIYIIPTK